MGGSLKEVLCAPDSFKGTLSAPDVAAAMAAGAAEAVPAVTCDLCPIADGGEGSLRVMTAALGGAIRETTVTGPLGEPVRARFGVAGTTGVVELAEASGLGLVPPDRRDPTRTTTFGTGELVTEAAAAGCETVIVCIGGSATVDGGTGAAQALGARFIDRSGAIITRPLTGGALDDIAASEAVPGLPRIRVACDVTNPLCGPKGAAVVYGPQKGATPAQVRQLDAALRRLASLTDADPDRPGSGAAGGAGFGLAAWCGATLEPGIDLILEVVGFRARCRRADLVLTGEGCLDDQSRQGKACVGVARVAAELNVPVVAIAGRVALGNDFGDLFRDVISLADRYGLERALAEPARLIAEVTAEVVGVRG